MNFCRFGSLPDLQMELQNDLGSKMDAERFQVRKNEFSVAYGARILTPIFIIFQRCVNISRTFGACDLRVRFPCDFLWISGPQEGQQSCKSHIWSRKIKVSQVLEKRGSRQSFEVILEVCLESFCHHSHFCFDS